MMKQYEAVQSAKRLIVCFILYNLLKYETNKYFNVATYIFNINLGIIQQRNEQLHPVNVINKASTCKNLKLLLG